MQDSQLATHLHFGAYVHISCFEQKSNFYLMSNGISFKSIIALAASDGPVQVSKALFRITPAVNFQSEQYLKKILEQRYQTNTLASKDGNSDVNPLINEKQAKAFIDQFDFQLTQNNRFVSDQKGFHLRYNQVFMLQHKYSCKYLCYEKNQQSNQYVLALSEIPNKHCAFSFQPCFGYQKDLNTYIPFNSSVFLSIKIYDGLQIRQLFIDFKMKSLFQPWVTSQENKKALRVGLYQAAQQIEYKNICYGDTIWIFHLETGSFIKSLQADSIKSNYILNKIKHSLGYLNLGSEEEKRGNEKQPQKSTLIVTQIMKKIGAKIILQKTENQMSAEKYGLWQVIYASDKQDTSQKQHKSRFKGGRIKFDQQVRFFNIRHESFLSVRKIKETRKKFSFQLATEKYEQPNTVFVINSLSGNTGYVTNEDLFLIKNVMTQTYLTLASPFQIGQQSAILKPSMDYKKEDNFKFTKIQFIQEWQNNFIISVFPYLLQGIEVCKLASSGVLSKKQQIMLEILCENLIELLTFSYDLTQGFEASESKLGKMTYNHFLVQKLFREQGVLKQIIEILKAINVQLIIEDRMPMPNQSFQKQSLKIPNTIKVLKLLSHQVGVQQHKNISIDRALIRKIVNVAFKILRNCCKYNNQSAFLIFKDAQVFIKYFSLGTYAQKFFIDSFSNRQILQKFGVRQFNMIIQQYFSVYQRTKSSNPQVFSLMNRFIKYDNQSINKNQLEIFKIFFDYQNPLVFRIEPSDDETLLIWHQGACYQLYKFLDQFPNQVLTLSSQLKFFANLTFGRNYVCSKRIKRILPLNIMIKYLENSRKENRMTEAKLLQSQIVEGFIQLITHTYLDQRPRFKQSKPLVYQFSGANSQNTKHEKIRKRSFQKGDNSVFQYEMKIMKRQGMSEQGINNVLSCINQSDNVDKSELERIKKWIQSQIEFAIKYAGQNNSQASSNGNQFYSSKMESCLMCLKVMIELALFTVEQAEQMQNLIQNVISEMGKTLVVGNQANASLQSKNFNELLLQMVEKNVIKRSIHESKFDGIEDQVSPDNICSIFVNYSFYQNILLLQKNPGRRQQTDKVIEIIIGLVQIYNDLLLEQKIKRFVGSAIDEEIHYRDSYSKEKLIQKIIVNDALENPMKNKENIFKLLLLLFYHSNAYKINFAAMDLMLRQVFQNTMFLDSLQSIVFVVDKNQGQKYGRLQSSFKEIRLLIQTSEIWLTNIFERNFQYSTIVHYFIDRVRNVINIVMPGYKLESVGLDSLNGAEKTILIQQQMIINNLNYEVQILGFIEDYRSNLRKITQITPQNKLMITLFKCCFLFLYVFIFNCKENKKKLQYSIPIGKVSEYFANYCQLQIGQTQLLVEYLKDNYQQCIEYYSAHQDTVLNFSKAGKYTEIDSRLFKTLLKYHQEPILANLKKFFAGIFQFSSFKKFMWINQNNQFELSLQRYLNQGNPVFGHPFFYHLNCMKCITYLGEHMSEARIFLKTHIKKSLSQKYLYQLLDMPDFFTQQFSRRCYFKVILLFKFQILELIEFAYLAEQRDQQLVSKELLKIRNMINKFIQQAPARLQTHDFRNAIPGKQLKKQETHPADYLIQLIYTHRFKYLSLHQQYINAAEKYCYAVKKFDKQDVRSHEINIILGKIHSLRELLLKSPKQVQPQYPIPLAWNFVTSASRDHASVQKKKYTCSLLIQSIFSQPIYKKMQANQKEIIKGLVLTFQSINLKQFLFMRKIAQFLEDAFQKLPNDPTQSICSLLKNLISFLSIWINTLDDENANQLRNQIGKSQIIFPILNFFQICYLDKKTKELFLISLQFFNSLIGEAGNRNIQTIFNRYFTNKSDSLEFFLKIKQILNQQHFEDRAQYECKKIYDAVEVFKNKVSNQKNAQFVVLNFLIALCKGSFKQNQIFLSSLSTTSNFNIMSGIWDILKNQKRKYNMNIVNIGNYDLISQCFATIRELVEGPCQQNQNQFLNPQFFQTIKTYFQFERNAQLVVLEPPLKNKLGNMAEISPIFAEKLEDFLNQDNISRNWMPSQVKYQCASLICSLLAQNVTEKSKSQLSLILPQKIVKQMDNVYLRYVQKRLDYSYENMQVKQQQEVILPLGFKLFEILQYFEPQKRPQTSKGLQFFHQNSRRIQVFHYKLCQVYFPRPITTISQAFKTKFLETVDRTSVDSKLKDLQEAQIQNRQSDSIYGNTLLLTAICLLIIDIILYDKNNLPFVTQFNFYPIFYLYAVYIQYQAVRILLILLVIVQSLVYFALQIKGAMYIRSALTQIFNSTDQNGQLEFWSIFKQLLSLFYNNLNYLHYALTFSLGILGIFNPFFDCILIAFELFRRSQTFSLILIAIFQTLDQLCVVLLLTVIMFYILTTIIYYYFAERQFSAQCESLYYCLVFSIDNGFKADAGIVGYNDSDTILQDFLNSSVFDVMMNFVYLFIIKVIIDQIIGAIIVDKFAQMRQQKQAIQKDQNDRCFICGLERNLLDRQQYGFQKHKVQYHNIWNYLQFLIHVRSSKISALTGIQLFVFEQQKNGKLQWFPINRSWHLQDKNKQQETESKSKQIQFDINRLEKIMDNELNQLKFNINQIWQMVNIKIAKQKGGYQGSIGSIGSIGHS